MLGTLIGLALLAGLIAMAFAQGGGAGELPTLGLRVLGQTELLASSQASLRIIVTDHSRGEPMAGAVVSVRLEGTGAPRDPLFVGRTDATGTVRAEFQVPDLEPGDYKLTVHASSGQMREKVEQTISIGRAFQILLTTDKPIYQPTQTMHLRAMALRLPTMQAAAGRAVTLEVSDAKGNKVFKHTAEANAFGIVAADFVLADEVNQGPYKIKALLGDDSAEKTVTVSRYVLPKFRVTVTPDRAYYLPGQRVEGTVQADYFFGKPVSAGAVDLTVKTFDFEFRDIAHITGRTDAQGTFRFEATLPSSFVGQPIEQGNAFLQLEARVTDQAEHTETAIATSTVSAGDLQVNALPESGELVPGVDNIVYVLVSRPTGEPAEANVNLTIASVAGDTDRRASLPPQRTDDLGIAQFTIPAALTALLEPADLARLNPALRPLAIGADTPRDASSLMVQVSAVAADGGRIERGLELTADASAREAALLLRTDRALYRVGDALRATALTGVPSGTVYFDVVKDRQTMLTQVAEIKSGQATTTISLGPQVTGTAWLSAYLITPLGQIVRAQRPIYIDPASDLSIDIAADRDSYLPGSEAKLDFTVRDADGRPVAAALGINVVDESVFALQELQPGMEKVFFYLEQELMEPRYEIHGFEMPVIIATEPGPQPLTGWERKDRAAQIIFASIDAPEVPVFDTDTFAARLTEARQKWLEDMQPKIDKIRDALNQYHERHNKLPEREHALYKLVAQGFLQAADIRDLWEQDMILEYAAPDEPDLWTAVLISLGPDGRRNTVDDLVMPLGSPWALQAWGIGGVGGPMGPGGPIMFDLAMPMAMAAEGAVRREEAVKGGAEPTAGSGADDKASVRVRSYFPETMFFEPSLITGADGRATLTMPMADSITTWRLAALANSAAGQLGSTTTGLRCFQDFFIDIDLPVALTQNDQVSIPIAVYNYLPAEQTVRIELTEEPWFELTGEATVSMNIAGNDVDVRYFTIRASKVGDHKLTVHGMGTGMSDAITRTIRIEPDGRKVEQTVSDRLNQTVEHTLNIPEQALADASTILVKVYPGIFSQVVEGLDAILQMPFGCFEQTSAATYPNILVLDYMRTVGQVTPEIDMKATGFINNGYQRMLSFECANGGFSWFGDEPANKILTAFGLMEFFDMQAVHNVDRAVIARTQQWLLGRQEADGSWKPDASYLHQESWSGIQSSELLPTAYVTWALAWTDEEGDGVRRGVSYVRENFKKAEDAYSLAICCNALVAADNALNDGELDPSTIAALDKLLSMAKEKDGRMWWESAITGITHSSGDSANLEATGYAGLALLNSGRYPVQTTAVINYLVSMKDARGTWHSTQATILALKVLLLSQGKATQKVNAEVTVSVNGRQAESFAMTPANADVMRLIDCRELVRPGDNQLQIRFSGEGSCLYQIVERHYLPWGTDEGPALREPLSIAVDYDRTRLAKDDLLNATVTVRNNTPAVTSMVVVDLGIPPGFSVETEDLANLVERGVIQKYSMTGRQIIVYLEELKANQVVELSYRLRAKFPIKAQTPSSRVYEYYNPDNQATAAPEQLEVTG